MKRKFLAVFLMLALLLTGCASGTSDTYEIEYNGVRMTVDTKSRQITNGEDVYSFTKRDQEISLVYPNGATCEQYYITEHTVAGDTEGDISGYLDPDILCYAIMNEPQAGSTGMSGGRVLAILLGIGLIAFGLWSCANPERVWEMENGWKFKDAEPSDLALRWNEVAGAIMVVIGIVMIIVGIFGRF